MDFLLAILLSLFSVFHKKVPSFCAGWIVFFTLIYIGISLCDMPMWFGGKCLLSAPSYGPAEFPKKRTGPYRRSPILHSLGKVGIREHGAVVCSGRE